MTETFADTQPSIPPTPPPTPTQPETQHDSRMDTRLLVLIVITFLAQASTWGMIFWKLPPTDATVFLHYNVFYGIDLAGSWRDLFWMPGTGLALFCINTVIVFFSKSMDRFLKTLIVCLTLLLEAMITYATFLIILLNANYAS